MPSRFLLKTLRRVRPPSGLQSSRTQFSPRRKDYRSRFEGSFSLNRQEKPDVAEQRWQESLPAPPAAGPDSPSSAPEADRTLPRGLRRRRGKGPGFPQKERRALLCRSPRAKRILPDRSGNERPIPAPGSPAPFLGLTQREPRRLRSFEEGADRFHGIREPTEPGS